MISLINLFRSVRFDFRKLPAPISQSSLRLQRLSAVFHKPFMLALAAALLLPSPAFSDILPGTRYPTNEEQYTLQLINCARTSADGLTILQSLVTNNLDTIVASTTGISKNGTSWSTGFWKSGIPGVANAMNFYKVHPGDLKKQFQDLVIPNTPLAGNPNLWNVAAGYNDLVIANAGVGPGFPHSLAPYADQSTFEAYAQRYLDGGYGPLNVINALAENIAPNGFSSALATFAAFMIDWGNTADGIQSQDPNFGSHRLSLMGSEFGEIGISRKPGWSTDAVTEVQEFGQTFTATPALVGAVYVDKDGNGFYTPGEGVGGITVTATPVGGGTALQTRTFRAGGYVLQIATPGDYTVTVTGAFGVLNAGTVTINAENVLCNVIAPQAQEQTDFNGDDKPDFVLYYPGTLRTQIWYLNGAAKIGQADGPTVTAGWQVAGVADFNGDGSPDYLLYNASTRHTVIWYMNGAIKIGEAAGPTLNLGWSLVGLEDFNRDGHVDYLLYNNSTRQTVVWYLNGATKIGSANGPTLTVGWPMAGVADFNGDGCPDYLIYNARRTVVWYLDGVTKIGRADGPILPSGWSVAGVADFNSNGQSDYLLYQGSTRQTAIWYLQGVTKVGTANSQIVPSGWSLVSP
jgi:hypothetical protein